MAASNSVASLFDATVCSRGGVCRGLRLPAALRPGSVEAPRAELPPPLAALVPGGPLLAGWSSV
jgi:hypothetical protein